MSRSAHATDWLGQIADKLCSAFGQDILDTLFSKETLEAAWWSDSPNLQDSKRKRRRKRERATPFFFFMLGLAYVREFTTSPWQVNCRAKFTAPQIFTPWSTFTSWYRSMSRSTHTTMLSLRYSSAISLSRSKDVRSCVSCQVAAL